MFLEGNEYSRVKDIHEIYGGQRQGGISTPTGSPLVFVFTGKAGEQHGYSDGWQDDGVFLYTGEGQVGDMEFLRGNAAIRDHIEKGKDLLMFEALGKSRPVKFSGKFACNSWDTFRGPDREGNDRECIQFHLVRISTDSEPSDDIEPDNHQPMDFADLRQRAFDAAKPKQTKKWQEARRGYRERSAAVRDYALARAAGVCELTGQPAPFFKKNGEPYLEVHHIRKLSDGGPDDPRHVAAIDPTVHREIHFGAEGDRLNGELEKVILEKEMRLTDVFI